MANSSSSQHENENLAEDKSIFSEFIDKLVSVKTENCSFEGICRSIDGYLNAVLENVEFYLQTAEGKEIEKTHLKTCFLAGGSIKHLNIIKQ